MSHVYATNANATSFPDVEVEYLDIVRTPFEVAGRWGGETIDCLGCLLEIYNRGGIGLPDPAKPGPGYREFMRLFDQIDAPTQLFDVLKWRRGEEELLTVVRPGLALTASRMHGAHCARLVQLRGVQNLTYWRLKTSVYPV